MRDIRDKLSERYLKNPELEKKDLENVRKRYKDKILKSRKVLTK